VARYKWGSAREWLDEKAQAAASAGDAAELLSIYNAIVGYVDNDSIQDEFQSEMDAAGAYLARYRVEALS
jgi:hypothetical protein